MEAGVVDQHDHGLALHVDARVVVPVLFRRVHAVADEDQLAAVDLHFLLAGARADHHVRAELQRMRLACDIDGHGRGGIRLGHHHRHGLEPVSYTHLDVYKRQA